MNILSAGTTRAAHLRVDSDNALAGEGNEVPALATTSAKIGAADLGRGEVDSLDFG